MSSSEFNIGDRVKYRDQIWEISAADQLQQMLKSGKGYKKNPPVIFTLRREIPKAWAGRMPKVADRPRIPTKAPKPIPIAKRRYTYTSAYSHNLEKI